MKRLLALLSVAASLTVSGRAVAYPVSVQSCRDVVRFDAAPARPVVNDSTMGQTIIDLGLTRRFIGFGAVKRPLAQGVLKGPPADLAWIAQHQIADRYPSTEAILGADADFYFAGWMFGLNRSTGVTPTRLAGYRIKTYVLQESCIRIGPRPPISMETMYTDVRAIGRIFNVEDRAERLIAGLKQRTAAVVARTRTARSRPKVLYCGTCHMDGPALVIGAEGMPAALISLAGGTNMFPEIRDSYVRVGWESVIDRNPDWIIISNPGASREDVIRYLTTTPALRSITAVRKRQFIFMTYPERSPSTRNVDALERLARTIHPELFR